MSWPVPARAAASAAFCSSDRVSTIQLVSTANATMPRMTPDRIAARGARPPRRCGRWVECRIMRDLSIVGRASSLPHHDQGFRLDALRGEEPRHQPADLVNRQGHLDRDAIALGRAEDVAVLAVDLDRGGRD